MIKKLSFYANFKIYLFFKNRIYNYKKLLDPQAKIKYNENWEELKNWSELRAK